MFRAFDRNINAAFHVVYITVFHARSNCSVICRFIFDIEELNFRICLIYRKFILCVICRCISCKVCVINIKRIICVCRECYACCMHVSVCAPSAKSRSCHAASLQSCRDLCVDFRCVKVMLVDCNCRRSVRIEISRCSRAVVVVRHLDRRNCPVDCKVVYTIVA